MVKCLTQMMTNVHGGFVRCNKRRWSDKKQEATARLRPLQNVYIPVGRGRIGAEQNPKKPYHSQASKKQGKAKQSTPSRLASSSSAVPCKDGAPRRRSDPADDPVQEGAVRALPPRGARAHDAEPCLWGPAGCRSRTPLCTTRSAPPGAACSSRRARACPPPRRASWGPPASGRRSRSRRGSPSSTPSTARARSSSARSRMLEGPQPTVRDVTCLI